MSYRLLLLIAMFILVIITALFAYHLLNDSYRQFEFPSPEVKTHNDKDTDRHAALSPSEVTAFEAHNYNLIGDCYFAMAKVNGNRELYKSALRDGYLRTKVMCAPSPGSALTYDYEKSLYFSAYCYEILSQYQLTNKRDVYITQARAIYAELIKDFPNSMFKGDAERQLKWLSGK